MGSERISEGMNVTAPVAAHATPAVLMRQVSQNYKTGAIHLEQVPPPALRAGGVLVQTSYSVISAGTEGMKVREGKLSYLGKARARPDQVKKVLATVRQQGLRAAYQKVMNKLDSLTPLGYSASGIVVGVGAGAEEFHVGQRVACAGAGYANHAEFNYVPKNLLVPIPDEVESKHAAFATIGAIALQGVRQAELQVGETACVIGLGLIGQILVQILNATGIRVMGIDLRPDRCQLAETLGAKKALTPMDPGLRVAVDRMTAAYGFDCVFISAGGSSNIPVELAVELARDRARVVDIGKTRLDLPWNDYYLKELDVRFSRSYGPGRYDPSYEEQGLDYPIGYVRWTERRNLESFLGLIADGKVKVTPLITSVRPFAEAEKAFQELSESTQAVLACVFEYSQMPCLPAAVVERRPTRTAKRNFLRLGVIGAGNYASSMLLPHLVRADGVELTAVATASSLSSENVRRKFGFRYATTNYRVLLEQTDIDAVLIATRHASHASMVVQALESGKAVYVEKPLALTTAELEAISRTVRASGNDRLMVGFNRRFSPIVRDIARQLVCVEPVIMHYRVHAGRLDRNSWYLDPSEGSRFVGEAGHFLDLMALLGDSRPRSIVARTLRPPHPTSDELDNLCVVVQYENGSIGNLLYLTQGGSQVPKEYLEVFGGGRTFQLDNFEALRIYEGDRQRSVRPRGIDKGQKEALAAFVEALRSGGPMPIPVQSLLDTTYATLASVRCAANDTLIDLAEFQSSGDVTLPRSGSHENQ